MTSSMKQTQNNVVESKSLSAKSLTATSQADWSHIGETLSLLALAVAQIDTSLHEGAQSVNQLTSNFIAMSKNTEALIQLSEREHANDSEVGQLAQSIHKEIQRSVVAFQFYDRLTQRLEHVSENLENMGHLINDSGQRYQSQAWLDLQNAIKGNYTMEAERIMFEHIMNGCSIREALDIYRHNFTQDQGDSFDTDDEIELL